MSDKDYLNNQSRRNQLKLNAKIIQDEQERIKSLKTVKKIQDRVTKEEDFYEGKNVDDIINLILGDFDGVSHVILHLGSLTYLEEDDLEQLLFLNAELKVKSGYLLIATQTDSIVELLNQKIQMADSIDDAIDLIESEWTDKELFS